MRDLLKLERRLRRKYPKKVDLQFIEVNGQPVLAKMPFGTPALSDKAKRILLKAVKEEFNSTKNMTAGRYRFLNNLYIKYSINKDRTTYSNPSLCGDFDGDPIELPSSFNPCRHIFSNGNSALIDIGNEKCRCELCNVEIGLAAVDEDMVTKESDVIQKILDMDLRTVIFDNLED